MKRKVKRPFDNEQFRKGYVAGIFAAEKELNTELLHFAEKAHKIMSEGTFPDYGVKINFKDSNNTITTNLDMTTEQKAKKYDEALEWMREVYPTLTGAAKEDAEHYFPELKESKESEDERIRKAIVELVKRTPSSMFDADTVGKWIGASHDEILAYLEKQKECGEANFREGYLYGFEDAQKEQKPAEYLSKEKVFAIMNKLTSLSFCVPLGSDEEKKIHEITCDVSSLLDYPIEQKPAVSREEILYQLFQNGSIALSDYLYLTEEQKPAEWSEEDIDIINVLEYIVGKHRPDEIFKIGNKQGVSAYKICSWLKSLKNRGNFPKSNTNSPNEWNEEDEALYNAFMCEVVNEKMNPTIEQVKWLRGIRDRLKSLRPQLHWKPSEEQMEALSETIAFAPDTFKPKCTLVTLQDDLKKLMEE